MEAMNACLSTRRQGGTSLIEVLVTLLIVAFGLLGMAGLQARMELSEMESYQRAQALVLLSDMANRITTNRINAANYATAAAPLGGTAACPASIATRHDIDKGQWCAALKGAAEFSGGNQSGAMIGGRGCAEALPDNEYLITVAWQGLTPVSAPPASVSCGQDLYDGPAGSPCQADRCRRVVTTVVRIATLN
jgi:type IV pilus assembly protein PilV